MKRLIGIALLLLTFVAQAHGDSDTVYSLTSVNPTSPTYGNAQYPSQLYTSLSSEQAGRDVEHYIPNFVSIVYYSTACLGTAGAGLTMTPTSCTAYNAGFRGTETGSITFSDNSTTWVAMDDNTSGNNAGLPNFTRVTGTHYLIDSIDVSEPSASSNSQLLMEVVTSGGSITSVTDLRNTSSGGGGGGSINPGALGYAAYYSATTQISGVPSTQYGVYIGGGTGAPSFTNIGTAGTLLQGKASANPAFTATAVLGSASVTQGTLTLTDFTSGSVKLAPFSGGSTWTWTFPTNGGTNGQCLQTNGSGATSWGTCGSGSGTVNSGSAGQVGYYATTGTAISGNSDLNIDGGTLIVGASGGGATGVVQLYDGIIGGSVGISAPNSGGTYTIVLPSGAGQPGNLLAYGTSGETYWTEDVFQPVGTPGGLTLGNAGSISGTMLVCNATGANCPQLGSQANTGANVYFNLPTSNGTNGQVLQTDGAGNTSWQNASGGGTVNSGTEYQVGYYASSGTAISGSADLTIDGGAATLGVSDTTLGSLQFFETGDSNSITLESSSTNVSSNLFILPDSLGSSGEFLETNGSGQTSWGSPSGSGTVNSGTAGQLTYYASSGTAVSGNADATISNGQLTLGVASSVLGDLVLEGSSSGAVTIKPQAAAGTYNFNLPTAAGSSGQPLLSGGGGATAMSFGTLGEGGGGTGVTSISQYYLVVGGAATLAGIAPSSTAGNPLVSGGSSANPAYDTGETIASGVITGTEANGTNNLLDFDVNNEVSPLAFGAACNGSTNDAAAFNAITTANSNAVVVLPPQTCAIDSKWTLGAGMSVICGAGVTGAPNPVQSGSPCTLTSTSTTVPIIGLPSGWHGTLWGFNLTRSVTATSGANGVDASGEQTQGKIYDLHADSQWDGVHLDDSSFGIVENLDASNNQHDGYLCNNSISNGGCQEEVIGGLFEKNANDGVACNQSTTGTNMTCFGEVTGVQTFANGGHGIAAYGNSGGIGDINISHSFTGSDGNDDIYINCGTGGGGQIQITGSTAELTGQEANGVSGGTAATNVGYGINIASGCTGQTTIANNLVHAPSYSGIVYNGDGYVTITGNTFYDTGSCKLGAGSHSACSQTVATSSGIYLENAGWASVTNNEMRNLYQTTQLYGISSVGDTLTAIGNDANGVSTCRINLNGTCEDAITPTWTNSNIVGNLNVINYTNTGLYNSGTNSFGSLILSTNLSYGGQITSTVATGTAPIVVTSTTPVAHLTTVPNIGNTAGNQYTNAKEVFDVKTLSSGTYAITFTSPYTFTSSGTYACWCNDLSGTNLCNVTLTSGTAATAHGSGSDLVAIFCAGD